MRICECFKVQRMKEEPMAVRTARSRQIVQPIVSQSLLIAMQEGLDGGSSRLRLADVQDQPRH